MRQSSICAGRKCRTKSPQSLQPGRRPASCSPTLRRPDKTPASNEFAAKCERRGPVFFQASGGQNRVAIIFSGCRDNVVDCGGRVSRNRQCHLLPRGRVLLSILHGSPRHPQRIHSRLGTRRMAALDPAQLGRNRDALRRHTPQTLVPYLAASRCGDLSG